MAAWTCVLTLNADRSVAAGSEAALADAVRGGADLRICTEFLYNEHVDTSSDNPEMVREVCEFKISYLLDDAWVAAVMGLRQPTHLPDGFGARPSMSFFLYNQNGQQAIARPYLDGPPATGPKGPVPPKAHPDMPKMLEQAGWDSETNRAQPQLHLRFRGLPFLRQRLLGGNLCSRRGRRGDLRFGR